MRARQTVSLCVIRLRTVFRFGTQNLFDGAAVTQKHILRSSGSLDAIKTLIGSKLTENDVRNTEKASCSGLARNIPFIVVKGRVDRPKCYITNQRHRN